MSESEPTTGKKVIVIGAGVGGLTAAHELIERGFQVEVYEEWGMFGGKARSSNVGGTASEDPAHDLPAEHGFRFFPGFYQHVPDTMKRIPVHRDGSRSVYDNLVNTKTVTITQKDRRAFLGPLQPLRAKQSMTTFKAWRHRKHLGLRRGDARFFACLMIDLMCTSRERRTKQYDDLSWFDYVDADGRGPAYKKLCAIGLTRNLVAMRASVASTRTVGNVLIQFFQDILVGQADRVLCGPTNPAWIDPWIAHLKHRGVRFHPRHKAVRLNLDTKTKQISSVTFEDKKTGYVPGDSNWKGQEKKISGDYYVAAVPVEAMTELIQVDTSPGVADRSVSLRKATNLEVEWMNGAQFYLKRDYPVNFGHQLHLDSAWALTSISQRQFWQDGAGDPDFAYDIRQRGDGTVRGIISVDISRWDVPGDQVVFKSGAECSREEIALECWAQLKDSLAGTAGGELTDDDLHSYCLDHDIADPNVLDPTQERLSIEDEKAAESLFRESVAPLRGRVSAGERLNLKQEFEEKHGERALVVNSEPLLINTVGSLKYRPEAGTEIENLVLASSYVKTNADLETMESASEAARRATNVILKRSGSSAPPAKVYEFKEFRIFLPFRAVDWVLFKCGLPQIGFRWLWARWKRVTA